MKLTFLLVAVAACSGARAEMALRAGTVATGALIACDLGQTYYASNDGKWDRPGDQPGSIQVETNPLLGLTPSPHVLLLDAIIGITANTVIGLSGLPRWARGAYLIAIGAVEGYVVAKHLDTAGVCGGVGEIR